jgi:hypothetical protein
MSDHKSKSLVKAAPWLVAAFVACFVVGGWLVWRGSYQEYQAGSFLRSIVLLIAIVAFALALLSDAGIIASATTIGCAFPAVIMVRVVLDVTKDPTDHNLWPFEIAIALVIGMGAAFATASLGGICRRLAIKTFKAHDRP